MNLEWISMYALAIGGALFVFAGIAYLVRETREVPNNQRLKAMAAIVWRAVRRALPSRQSLVVASAGFGVFLFVRTICGHWLGAVAVVRIHATG